VGGGTCRLVTAVGSVPPPGAGEHGSGGWYRSHWVGPVGMLALAARDMSTIDLYFQFKFKTSRLN
jgi:hypothetical protein